ncbi:hypothetical protein ON010_g9708 [Phytophthora cinnamomi]|nr:hypothetical protein ON010_g9708 [Phytophthora cinnamomi]
MLLALFLHPRHVRLAVAIHKEAPPLRFLERLCGYGIYYYRRYFEIDGLDEIKYLAADLHAWYRGKFVDEAIVRFNGDVAQYWSFASDLRPTSKLPDLAAVILSIAVNTATCERYFSELASIHTAIKNRMKVDKARKLSLVRKAVRELDKAEDAVNEFMTIKRIVVAAERKRIGNCDSVPALTLAEIEESQVIQHQETPSSETPEYWQDIFDVLDSEEITRRPDAGNEESTAGEDPLTPPKDIEQTVYNGYEEDIPEADTTEFPNTNVKTFPSETKLTGLRGQTFSLARLHGQVVVLVVDLVSCDGDVGVLGQVEAVRVLRDAVAGAVVDGQAPQHHVLGCHDAGCAERHLLGVPRALVIQDAGALDRQVHAAHAHQRTLPLQCAEPRGAHELDGGAGLGQAQRDAGRNRQRVHTGAAPTQELVQDVPPLERHTQTPEQVAPELVPRGGNEK